MTKLLILCILFSTAVRALVVAKLVMLGISPLTLFILALREALIANLVISGIFSPIFLILALYASFLTISTFTASLGLLKSTETGTNLSISHLSTVLFKFPKLGGTFSSLSVSNLSTLDFKLVNLSSTF